MAAGAAEHAISVSVPPGQNTPLAPEILVPRLGEILLERGLVSEAELQETLQIHRSITAAGKPQLFGHLLLERGLVDRETLDMVVTEQILQLQQALQRTNQQLEQRVQERTNDLQKALSKLAELNQLKSNFISNISHELRTPLTHIKGYMSLLADETLGPLSSEQHEAIDVLVRAEARLEQLIEDLIQFSLVARGELSVALGVVDLRAMMLSSAERLRPFASSRQVAYELQIADNLPLVRADGDKIAWALLQLQENGVKFTQAGGRVCLEAVWESGLVTVRVSDTGIGIPPHRLEEIFEPFHQLDGSNTRRQGGTGLGLALVKRILEAHGSGIKVQSTINEGSVFEFSLPAVVGSGHV